MKVKKYVIVITLFLISFLYTNNVFAEELESKFDLRDHIDITVRNQETTNTCWAFAISNLLTTHLSYINHENFDFSPRHLEYLSSENAFSDGSNPYAFQDKHLGDGGNENIFKDYWANGRGPILEINMPFVNNESPITSLSMPMGIPFKQVTEARHIYPMYKEWNENKLIYKNYKSVVITQEQVSEYRNSVKTAIKNYGGVDATISFVDSGFNVRNGSFNTKAMEGYWHSVVLIGWDDGYSKDNFNIKPSMDGAYIALNSWGTNVGNNGYMYISYEDVSIDAPIKTYLVSVEDVDFDNAYSYEDLGTAKENGETLTEFTINVDSCLVGSVLFNLKIDDEYIYKNQLLDVCYKNYKLKKPVVLNPSTKIEFNVDIDDIYKDYFYPYFYTVTNTSQCNIGNILELDDKVYFYTENNIIDNGRMLDLKIMKNNKNVTEKFYIIKTSVINGQTENLIINMSADPGEYIVQINNNGTIVNKAFNVYSKTSESIEDIENFYRFEEPKPSTTSEIPGGENDPQETSTTPETSGGENDSQVTPTTPETSGGENDPQETPPTPETPGGENDPQVTSTTPEIPSEQTEAEETLLLGDVSLDNRITVTDLSQLKSYIVGLNDLTKDALKNADLNKDEKITIIDLSVLKMKLAGLA